MSFEYYKDPWGSLTVITGPMFSAKTQKLKAYLSVHSAIGDKCLLISHSIDERGNLKKSGILTNHDDYGSGIPSSVSQVKVGTLSELNISEYDIIAIDESQFFPDILLVKEWLLSFHKTIYAAGLISTSEGNMFGEFYKLLPFANKIKHLKACCVLCKEEIKNPSIRPKAIMTKSLVPKDKEILVGSESYIPTCLRHWNNN